MIQFTPIPNPALEAAVDRLVAKAADYLRQRDVAHRRSEAAYDRLSRDAYEADAAARHRDAWAMAHAACIVAEAGLCDIAIAFDYSAVAEESGHEPELADYRRTIRRAVDQNR